jgi:hypothetical protein
MKYSISKKPLTPNSVWDAKSGMVVCHFVNGKFETDDADLAKKLEAMGHTVTKGADAEADAPKDDNGDPADGDGADSEDGIDGADGNDADAEADAKTATKSRRSRTAKK